MKYKNIIIISYLFPPLNQIGAKRAYYFAKYLSKAGFKVTVLTSELPEKHSIWDANCSSFRIIRFKRQRTSLFPKNLIDGRLGKIFRSLDFFLSPIESENRILFNSISIESPDIIIATGGPWQSFEYGVEMKKIYPKSKLIFDYRDPWSIVNPNVSLTALSNFGAGIIGYLKSKRILRKEKQLLSFASGIISVTSPVLENSLSITKKNISSKVIFNGYDNDDLITKGTLNKIDNEFWISYTGILKKEQEYKMFLNAIKKLFNNNPYLIEFVKFKFIGSKNPKDKIIKKEFSNYKYEKNIDFTNFVNKKEVKMIQSNSNVLLHFSFTNKKGIMSGKIFEYLAMNKPILLISKNNDVMENLVLKTKSGKICRTETEIENTILNWYKEWKDSGNIVHKPNNTEKLYYTYKYQINELVSFINQI